MKLATATCVSCHGPHAQKKGEKGLIRPAQHLPFVRNECESCHTSRGAAALAQKVPELCVTCHEPVKEKLAKAHVHLPVASGKQCLACHSPHAGAAAPLLNRAGDSLCCTCHDRRMAEGKVRHKALEQGCVTCHDAHSSDAAKLLKQGQPELCQTCHRDLSKHFHPTGGKAKDPRTGGPLACTSSHRPHASEIEGLLTHEPKRELCIQCHDPSMAPRGK